MPTAPSGTRRCPQPSRACGSSSACGRASRPTIRPTAPGCGVGSTRTPWAGPCGLPAGRQPQRAGGEQEQQREERGLEQVVERRPDRHRAQAGVPEHEAKAVRDQRVPRPAHPGGVERRRDVALTGHQRRQQRAVDQVVQHRLQAEEERRGHQRRDREPVEDRQGHDRAQAQQPPHVGGDHDRPARDPVHEQPRQGRQDQERGVARGAEQA